MPYSASHEVRSQPVAPSNAHPASSSGDKSDGRSIVTSSTPKAPNDDINLTASSYWQLQLNLAQALGDLFVHTGQPAVLEEQITVCCSVIATSSTPPDILQSALRVLGSAKRARFEQKGQIADIDDSVNNLRTASTLADPSSTRYCWSETELGRSLTRRYQRTGVQEDLTEAIQLQRHAAKSVANDDPDRDQILFNLGNVLWVEYTAYGELSTLKEAIAHHLDALDLRAVVHRDRHVSLNGLAIAFKLFYERSMDPNHLNLTIKYHREALSLRPEGHPERSKSFNNLATTLELRYTVFGQAEDLESSIDMARQALALRPVGHPLRSGAMMNLAIPLSYRAVATGNLGDIEESIRMKRECLAMTSPGNTRRGLFLINLADTVRMGYDIMGRDNDLKEAMMLFREAVQTLPEGHHDHSLALFGLIGVLEQRFDASGQIDDLIEAMNIQQPWFENPDNESNSQQSDFAETAARVYRRYFEQTGDYDSLQNSVRYLFKSVELRKEGHLSLYRSLHELALALRVRFLVWREQEDLQRAVDYQYRALKLLPKGHFEYAQLLSGAAHLHLMHNTPFFDPYLSVELLAEALSDTSRSARLRLVDCLPVFEAMEQLFQIVAIDLDLRHQVLSLYKTAVSLLPRAACFSLDVRSRLRVIEKSDWLGRAAGIHSIIFSRVENAVEILEQGRAVFWTQYLRLRTSFDALPDHLRHELTKTTRQLELGPFFGVASDDADFGTARLSEEVARQRQLSNRIEALVQEARLAPGFERFMFHDSFQVLSRAALKGPVLIFLANAQSAYVIALRAPQAPPECILLPGVNNEVLGQINGQFDNFKKRGRQEATTRSIRQTSVSRKQGRNVLDELWAMVAHVVVTALECHVRLLS